MIVRKLKQLKVQFIRKIDVNCGQSDGVFVWGLEVDRVQRRRVFRFGILVCGVGRQCSFKVQGGCQSFILFIRFIVLGQVFLVFCVRGDQVFRFGLMRGKQDVDGQVLFQYRKNFLIITVISLKENLKRRYYIKFLIVCGF